MRCHGSQRALDSQMELRHQQPRFPANDGRRLRSSDAEGNGKPCREPVQGPGLFGVEFVADSGNSLAYRISVACPTTSSGQTNAASLGNGISIESPLMPAKVVGENLTAQRDIRRRKPTRTMA